MCSKHEYPKYNRERTQNMVGRGKAGGREGGIRLVNSLPSMTHTFVCEIQFYLFLLIRFSFLLTVKVIPDEMETQNHQEIPSSLL